MTEELKSIEVNNTWSLVELPKDKKGIDVKWVYKVIGPDAEIHEDPYQGHVFHWSISHFMENK